MPALIRLLAHAAIAGLICGLLLTAVQRVSVEPLLLRAEAIESASDVASPSGHAHEAQEAMPSGWRRTALTVAANIVIAVGFALLLGAGMTVSQDSGWRAGLVWAAAGYFVFFVAPSLGLPPELPGADSAPLLQRQRWWLLATVLSAAGLWIAVYFDRAIARIFGVGLLVIPHLIGAPLPPIHRSLVPDELCSAFVRATGIANAILWLALGVSMGYFQRRTRRR